MRTLITIIVLMYGQNVFGQNVNKAWRVNNRLQIGIEDDSNVEESLNQENSARGLRLQFTSQAKRRWQKTSIQFHYQGGYQLYWTYTPENKLINEISAQAGHKISQKVKIGIQSWGRLKMFLNRDLRYAIGDVGAFLNIKLPKAFLLHVSLKSEGLDYAASDSYDYSGPQVRIRLDKRFASGIQITPEWAWHRFHFNRSAFDISSEQFWISTGEHQEDHSNTFGCQVDWVYKGLLLNLRYYYEIYHSNSYGFNFKRHRVHVIAAKRCYGLLLRCYATLQRKSYSDDLLPFWPLQLDTEKEESNFLVIDISRELFPSVILLLRASWYQNESPWPNLYYSKRLFNLGVEFRF